MRRIRIFGSLLSTTLSRLQIRQIMHSSTRKPISPASDQLQAAKKQVRALKRQLKSSRNELLAHRHMMRLYQNAVEYSLDLVAAINSGYHYVFVNAAFEKYFQRPRTDICGRTVEDIMGEEEFAKVKPYLDRSFKGERIQFEKKYFNEDNQECTLLVAYFPLPDAQPGETIVILVVRDVSDQRRLDTEREKVQRLESLGVIAGGIAHDFNNLLSGIFGYMSLARRSESIVPEISDNLDSALQAFHRAKDLTQQLLTFAKGGSPIKKPARIDGLIRRAVSFNLSGSNVDSSVAIEDDLWPATIDEGQIHQVISNVVINARQAMPRGGKLDVTARNRILARNEIPQLEPGHYVEIRIQDHGVGIEAKNLDKIFEPFFTTKPEGSGLGLSLSFAIMKKHDGYITAISTVGQGSVFFLYLPALSPQEFESSEEAPLRLTAGSGYVLVMDDEEPIRILIKKLLEQQQYQVLAASDGESAVAIYRTALAEGKKIGLVILDLTIRGGMGGKETIQQLKAINPNVKAIISSGYSHDAIMSDPVAYGFSAVVPKPFQPEALLSTVQQVLSRGAS